MAWTLLRFFSSRKWKSKHTYLCWVDFLQGAPEHMAGARRAHSASRAAESSSEDAGAKLRSKWASQVKIKMLDISRHDVQYSTVDWMAIFFRQKDWYHGVLPKMTGVCFFFDFLSNNSMEMGEFQCLKRHMKCWKQWMNSGRSCRRPEVVFEMFLWLATILEYLEYGTSRHPLTGKFV